MSERFRDALKTGQPWGKWGWGVGPTGSLGLNVNGRQPRLYPVVSDTISRRRFIGLHPHGYSNPCPKIWLSAEKRKPREINFRARSRSDPTNTPPGDPGALKIEQSPSCYFSGGANMPGCSGKCWSVSEKCRSYYRSTNRCYFPISNCGRTFSGQSMW